MPKIATVFFIVLLSSAVNFAQSKAASSALPKTYWLKYSLIFFSGCQPIVSPDNIVFTEGDCYTVAYLGKILERGTEVKLISINKNNTLAKISFTSNSVKYEIALKQKSEKEFRKAFKLLFSDKQNDYTKCPKGDIKTKKQVIRCYGFPITVTKKGDVDEYFYICEFSGFCGAFDQFYFEIKNNKVIKYWGFM